MLEHEREIEARIVELEETERGQSVVNSVRVVLESGTNDGELQLDSAPRDSLGHPEVEKHHSLIAPRTVVAGRSGHPGDPHPGNFRLLGDVAPIPLSISSGSPLSEVRRALVAKLAAPQSQPKSWAHVADDVDWTVEPRTHWS